MRVEGSEIVERAEQIRQANEDAARDPEQVLATLTRHSATFTERDLDRYLAALDESVPLANLLLELLDMLLGSGVWANAGVAISTVVHASAALLTAALPAGARAFFHPSRGFPPSPPWSQSNITKSVDLGPRLLIGAEPFARFTVNPMWPISLP